MSRIQYWINRHEEGANDLAEQMRQAEIDFSGRDSSGVSTLDVDGSRTYGVPRIREVVMRLATNRSYLRDLLPKTKLGTDIELAGGALLRPLLLDGRIGVAMQGCLGSSAAIIGSMMSDQMANLAQELLTIAQVQRTIEWLVDNGGGSRRDSLSPKSQGSIPLLKDLGWVMETDDGSPFGTLIKVTESGCKAAGLARSDAIAKPFDEEQTNEFHREMPAESEQIAKEMGLQPGDEVAIGSHAYRIVCIKGKVTGRKIAEHGCSVMAERDSLLDLRLPGWDTIHMRCRSSR